MKFIKNIGAFIEEYVSKSSNINIAVALASKTAIDILGNANKGCKVKFVVGIDLPTSFDVLECLMEDFGNNARIYNSEMFHPKVYLFTLFDGTKKAILGSGNFTNGGLYDNIEASVLIDDSDSIAELEDWFNTIYVNSQPITDEFLVNYKEYADVEIKHLSNKRKHMKQLQTKLDIYADVRENAVKLLRRKIKDERFADVVNNRAYVLNELYKYIDFANHFKDFNIDSFFKVQELGHIVPIFKSYLQEAKANGQLAKVLDILIDETIPLSKRFDMAYSTESKVKGLGINFLSKILCVYNPEKYVIWNKPAETFFDQIGLLPDKGLTIGEQYEFYCNFFRIVCKDAGIPDMATLDALIWE